MNCPQFSAILSMIERDMADYYGFELAHRAEDHLVDDAEMIDVAACTEVREQPRAGVYFSETDGEFAIGMHFDAKIRDALLAENPLHTLSNRNLDAFCAIVEELSHFHLLINRIRAAKRVSFLELELQAEIDKLLFSGLYLEKFAGDPHIDALMILIFDSAMASAGADQHYAVAERLAARFWLDFVKGSHGKKRSLNDRETRQFLQRNYNEHLSEKRLASDGAPVIRAA